MLVVEVYFKLLLPHKSDFMRSKPPVLGWAPVCLWTILLFSVVPADVADGQATLGDGTQWHLLLFVEDELLVGPDEDVFSTLVPFELAEQWTHAGDLLGLLVLDLGFGEFVPLDVGAREVLKLIALSLVA